MTAQEQLGQMADRLHALGAVAEQRFLEIGRSLEQTVGVLDRLATTFGSLFAELGSATLTQARDNLSQAAVRIDSLAETQHRRIATLDKLASAVGSIGGRIVRMRAVLREVDILALNARLAAVSMGDAGTGFLLFANEINRSTTLAGKELDQLDRELADAGQHLHAARASTHDFAQRHTGSMQTIPRNLAASVEAIEAHGRAAAGAVSAVGARSQKVGRQVAEAIMGLQLGDITRQRIEHVHHACALLRDGGRQGIALPALGCRVLAAQLLNTADELDREAEHVVGQLRAIAADALEVAGLAGLTYGTANRQRGSFLSEVESSVRQAQSLFAAVQAAHNDVGRHMETVSVSARTLAGHVAAIRTLDADIHIMGLNTSLKCGRLGAIGRPLSVIAQALRDCGGRTALLAAAVLAELDQLLLGAASLTATEHDHAESEAIGAGHGMLEAVERLSETGQHLSMALSGLETDSDTVGDLLAAAVERFTVRHEISQVLREAAAGCTRLAETSGEPDGDASTASCEHLLSLIAGLYTMAREREVHARFAPLSGDDKPVSRTADADLADLLF